MNYYFEPPNTKRFRGIPRITLPAILNNDIVRTIQNETFYRNYGVEKMTS